MAATSGSIAEGGNGETLLTLISRSTKRCGCSALGSPNMKSQSHSIGN